MLPLTLVESFFDGTKPCPPEIKDCEVLRAEYAKEIDAAQNTRGGCPPCKLRGIRNKFILRITNG